MDRSGLTEDEAVLLELMAQAYCLANDLDDQDARESIQRDIQSVQDHILAIPTRRRLKREGKGD